VTTPKQITWKLVRYARKHPETQLEVFEIPQVPGYRHASHSNKSIAESLSTTAMPSPSLCLTPTSPVDFLPITWRAAAIILSSPSILRSWGQTI
jgi:hypothetical protein